MATLLGTLLYGIAVGSLYGLIGIGLSLILMSAGVLDLARGQLVVMAALLAAHLENVLGIPLLPTVVICGVVLAALGGLEYLVAIAPLRGPDRLAGSIVTTLGVGITLQAVVGGVDSGSHGVTTALSGLHLELGSLVITGDALALIGVTLVGTTVVWWLLIKTAAGRHIRAAAEDAEVAALRGISVRTVAILSFVLAGALAGLGGAIAAPVPALAVQIGYAPLYTIDGLVAMVIGGTGSIWGALVGGVVIGILEEISATYISPAPAVAELVGLVALVVILLLRPQGIIAPRRMRLA